jgi:hypothetical protein
VKRKFQVAIAIVLVIILCFVLLVAVLFLVQKPFVPLKVNGKIAAVARRSFFQHIGNYGSADVYAGKKKIFSMWEDYWSGPVFIYPFADGKRFLCDYDDDTSLLDFVVDIDASGTNVLNSRMTNVGFETKGIVRLPNDAELQEVVSYLNGTTATSTKAGYFDFFFFGTKQLLLDLATNRQSVDPMWK